MSEDQQRFRGRDLTEALSAARRHFKLSRRDIDFEVVNRPDLGPVPDDDHAVVEILARAKPGAVPGSGEEPEPAGETPEERRPPRRRERRRDGAGEGQQRRRGRRRERDREETEPEEREVELGPLLPGEEAELPPEQLVQHLAEALIQGLDLQLHVEAVERNPMGLRVRMDGADAESLLEEKAEGLEMFQYLANRILHRDGRVSDRVSFDAGGYRAEREQGLLDRARELCEEVRRTGESQKMPPMGAYERRLVHLSLMEEPGIRSFSSGSGGKRRLHIAPAEPSEDGGEGGE